MKRFATIAILLATAIVACPAYAHEPAGVAHEHAGHGEPRSPHWHTFRNAFIAKHPACAICGTTKDVEAHHVVPYHLDKSKELDETNLITLCREDHLIFGHLDSWKSDGNPAVRKQAERVQDLLRKAAKK